MSGSKARTRKELSLDMVDGMSLKDTQRLLKVMKGDFTGEKWAHASQGANTRTVRSISYGLSSSDSDNQPTIRVGREAPDFDGALAASTEELHQAKSSQRLLRANAPYEAHESAAEMNPLQFGRHIDVLVAKGKEVLTGHQLKISRTQEMVRRSIDELKEVKREESRALRHKIAQLQQKFRGDVQALQERFAAETNQLSRRLKEQVQQAKDQYDKSIKTHANALAMRLDEASGGKYNKSAGFSREVERRHYRYAATTDDGDSGDGFDTTLRLEHLEPLSGGGALSRPVYQNRQKKLDEYLEASDSAVSSRTSRTQLLERYLSDTQPAADEADASAPTMPRQTTQKQHHRHHREPSHHRSRKQRSTRKQEQERDGAGDEAGGGLYEQGYHRDDVDGGVGGLYEQQRGVEHRERREGSCNHSPVKSRREPTADKQSPQKSAHGKYTAGSYQNRWASALDKYSASLLESSDSEFDLALARTKSIHISDATLARSLGLQHKGERVRRHRRSDERGLAAGLFATSSSDDDEPSTRTFWPSRKARPQTAPYGDIQVRSPIKDAPIPQTSSSQPRLQRSSPVHHCLYGVRNRLSKASTRQGRPGQQGSPRLVKRSTQHTASTTTQGDTGGAQRTEEAPARVDLNAILHSSDTEEEEDRDTRRTQPIVPWVKTSSSPAKRGATSGVLFAAGADTRTRLQDGDKDGDKDGDGDDGDNGDDFDDGDGYGADGRGEVDRYSSKDGALLSSRLRRRILSQYR